MNATWTRIPSPTTADWIGLYATSTAGDRTFVTYVYLSGAAAGTAALTIPVTAATGTTYELRLFSNGAFTRLATSGTFTVT